MPISEPRIQTPCPSCGNHTLFIGTGGHLTCSLIGCREPGVERAIAALRAENEKIRHGASRLRCDSHKADASHAWGCPECVHELRSEVAALRAERVGLEDILARRGHNETCGVWCQFPDPHCCTEHDHTCTCGLSELRAALASRPEEPTR